MPSLKDCIEQWSQEPLDLTDAGSFRLILGVTERKPFDLTEAESFQLSLDAVEKDQNGFEYKFGLFLSSPTVLSIAEDKLQKAKFKTTFHVMIELLPVSSYGELINTIKDMFLFYNDLDRLALPPSTEKNIIPAKVVKRSESRPFEIEE